VIRYSYVCGVSKLFNKFSIIFYSQPFTLDDSYVSLRTLVAYFS